MRIYALPSRGKFMIKLVSRFSEEPIADPNYIKIAASIKAYGLSRPFCTVWQSGSALLCRIDGFFTLYGDDFDADEVRTFINAVGAVGLSCSSAAAERLSLPHKTYTVMKSERGLSAQADFSPSCDEVYRLLALGSDGDISLPERTAFIADLSHRIRHETAFACTLKGTVCTVPYITDGGALICGVSAGESRGAGFAGMCVAAAVNRAARPCFVICSDSLIPFYKKFGFTECGKNAEIIF